LPSAVEFNKVAAPWQLIVLRVFPLSCIFIVRVRYARLMKHGFAFLLLVTASQSWPAWEVLSISADKQVAIYGETTTLRREANFVFAWVIYNRSTAAPDGSISSKALNQYDCDQYQARAWEQSFFDAPMATGNRLPGRGRNTCEARDTVETGTQARCESPWLPVKRGTTGEDLLRALCVF